MALKTVRRDWLLRKINAGLVEGKCNYRYSDDYAWDAQTNFGKTDRLPVVVHNTGRTFDSCKLNLLSCYFGFSSGRAWRNEDGSITFVPLSGTSYTLWVKEAAAQPEMKQAA